MNPGRSSNWLTITLLVAAFVLAIMVTTQWVSGAEIEEGRAQSNEFAGRVYRNATFTVNYRESGNTGQCDTSGALGALQTWPTPAKAAMNHVFDILDDHINSSVTIVIDACYQADSSPGSLAFASAVDTYTDGGFDKAVALLNAKDGLDNNGARPEIMTSVNANQNWDYCTSNCTVDPNKFDFVSTLVHEVLHGLGFSMSFAVDNANNPTTGTYSNPAGISDSFVWSDTGTQLTTQPRNTAALLNLYLSGSGKIEFRGPNTMGINGSNAVKIYSTTTWEDGSSMSHLDDNHPSNLGRMMNAATPMGPSARTLDAVTLMFMKDIGWSVNDSAKDFGDSAMDTAYGSAVHIINENTVENLRLGAAVSTEAAAAAADSNDDGVTKTGTWTSTGGQLAVSVTGSAGAKGCLSAWADWNGDNDFSDSNETLLSMKPVTIGSSIHSITFGSGVNATTNYNMRFRLMQDWDADGTCNDQVAMDHIVGIMSGEVEDYQMNLSAPAALNNDIYLPIVMK